MPLYDFKCADCGLEFEELVTSSSATATCPDCKSSNTTRKMSAPSPLKTGAFPFKPGPVRPLSQGSRGGCPSKV
ncbi:MAG: zinc ribbon domain-containing protein [Desulfovibrionaceae bacterium]|nr:zinc ribbon domain-containing protein [Desulfovibrionaceae bacterium]